MLEYVNLNGKIIRREKVNISPDNRSFRYGDGFFETMKFINGEIVLATFHYERLFSSLEKLNFDLDRDLTSTALGKQIELLAKKNNHLFARVRCTFYRGDGGLYDAFSNKPNYIIQTWALSSATNTFNENGLVVDFYGDARKVADQFSAIKSNNFLPYIMGAMYAKENQLNDCILLNPYNNIADATIANVFIVKQGIIKTPPLTDGAVNGIMRRFIIKCIKAEGMPFAETSLSTEDFHQASEVFFTNVIYGIKWVRQVGASTYSHQLASFLHKKYVYPLFNGATF